MASIKQRGASQDAMSARYVWMPVCMLLVQLMMSLPGASAISIEKFGAVPFENSQEAATNNSEALKKALLWSNSSSTDRTVQIPAGKNYVVFNTTVQSLYNVNLQIDGNLTMVSNISWWPYKGERPENFAMLTILDSQHMKIGGDGVVDGQGYDWWWAKFLLDPVQRPYMFVTNRCSDFEIYGFTAKNSPKYHFRLYGIKRFYIHDIKILVDVFKQKAMMMKHGHWLKRDNVLGGLPIFPLNTDGIDPKGEDVLIENCYIENFDDAVAVKPSSSHDFTNCTQNITTRNSVVRYGVGMTIGSVPPNTGTNCVRNVLFENIVFHTPIKAIYVKTNPGTSGDGLIDRVTYRNITGNNSLWYPIWIGPQQQQQPGSHGTGCSFLYPIIKQCPTQPRVPITNIVLEDINFTNGLTLPGVLLCNSTNPCTGFEFKNVRNNGEFLVQKDYVCQNIIHSNSTNSSPAPGCF